MVSLVALISSGKGTWSKVLNLINSNKWDNVYLICNDFSYDKFEINPSKAIKIKLDEKNVEKSMRIISNFFKKNIKDFEVAVNISSGSGEEHMLLLASLLKSGLGLRFVRVEGGEIKEYEIFEEKFTIEE